MIMASNGGDNGGIDPPEDLYEVRILRNRTVSVNVVFAVGKL